MLIGELTLGTAMIKVRVGDRSMGDYRIAGMMRGISGRRSIFVMGLIGGMNGWVGRGNLRLRWRCAAIGGCRVRTIYAGRLLVRDCILRLRRLDLRLLLRRGGN